MSNNRSNQGEIRKNILEADLVDCMVTLPEHLFYSTQVPACLWLIARNKEIPPFRKRNSEILFIDARKLGVMVDQTHRELTDEDIKGIAQTYHAWRGDEGASEYADVIGFCKSTTLTEVQKHDNILTPGRYVGVEVQIEDNELFEDIMGRLTEKLTEQMAEARQLDDTICENLQILGFRDE